VDLLCRHVDRPVLAIVDHDVIALFEQPREPAAPALAEVQLGGRPVGVRSLR